MKDKFNVVITVDDIHPEPNWGMPGDVAVSYMENLWEEFGCKFVLFVPSNYHGRYPLSEHPEWIDFWKSKQWIELSAHGHFHSCRQTNIGECEFLELDYSESMKRIQSIKTEWDAVKVHPKGFRLPGWLCTRSAAHALGGQFSYIAAHAEHNIGISFADAKVFFGHDGIDDCGITQRDGTIVFQSHIAGEHNDNRWNRENYDNFRMLIQSLKDDYILEFKTFSELL